MTLVVVTKGVATTVQDNGRAGLAHLGIAPSGAVDSTARERLNRALGNPADAAVIETAGGLRLHAEAPVTIIRDGDLGPIDLAAGSQLTVDPRPGRVWGYLAVRGGVDAVPVLGSRSRDVLSGLGPEPISEGVVVRAASSDLGRMSDVSVPPGDERGAIRVRVGPRVDWFSEGAIQRLLAMEWRVTETGRVGIRLGGGTIERAVHSELASEGLLSGAMQIPSSGEPLVMGRDHPTTGGYPVIAVVDPHDLISLMQRRVGSDVRFSLAPT